MTDKPVWLLDIDGVLNAVTSAGRKPPHHVWPARDWIRTHANDSRGARWSMTIAQPVIAFVRKVHEEGLAEIRWHTTWQEAANSLNGIGLPVLPVQEAPEFIHLGDYDRWWKLPAVWRVLTDEGRRVLWTDDDADWELRDEQKSSLAEAGCRIISPDTYTGLTPKHLRLIGEYLETDALLGRAGS